MSFSYCGAQSCGLLKLRPHQCTVEQDIPFPHPVACAVLDALQCAVGLPGCLDTLLTRVQLAVSQDPPDLFQ